MSNDTNLTRATPAELVQSLSYALRFDDRGKGHNRNRELMAQITAEALIRHLDLSGFVVMKKPPRMAPRVPGDG